MGQFLGGLAISAIGVLISLKSEPIYKFTGPISFFEKYLGSGGSRLGLRLIGILFFFIGVLTFTGMIGGFLSWILGPILRTMGGGIT